MAVLKRLQLKGFKSIQALDLELKPMNVLLGVNGSGKSNLISFFQMLNMMMTGNLQLFVGRQGGANSILHYGTKVTPQIEASLDFEFQDTRNTYRFRLAHGAPDTLIFMDEEITYSKTGYQKPKVISFGAGHKESALDPGLIAGDDTSRVTRGILSRCRMYQFHDTSAEAFVRQKCRVDDNRFLKHNGGNLAAILFRLQNTHTECYNDIISTARSIVARFDTFVLQPDASNSDWIMLNWRERDNDTVFGPHQLSDGSVRAIALTTLLSLPEDETPNLIVIDEPELGLHPAAISQINSLLHQKSKKAQIVLATQSMTLASEFDLFDAVVCDRKDAASDIGRRSPADVDGWADEYSLGQLWESRKIGAWPK